MHRFPLKVPEGMLHFDCFYLFALDFGIVPKNAQPREVKNALVVMDKFDLKGENDFNYLDIEQFTEAMFVLAFSKVLIPNMSKKATGRINLKSKFFIFLML